MITFKLGLQKSEGLVKESHPMQQHFFVTNYILTDTSEGKKYKIRVKRNIFNNQLEYDGSVELAKLDNKVLNVCGRQEEAHLKFFVDLDKAIHLITDYIEFAKTECWSIIDINVKTLND